MRDDLIASRRAREVTATKSGNLTASGIAIAVMWSWQWRDARAVLSFLEKVTAGRKAHPRVIAYTKNHRDCPYPCFLRSSAMCEPGAS